MKIGGLVLSGEFYLDSRIQGAGNSARCVENQKLVITILIIIIA